MPYCDDYPDVPHWNAVSEFRVIEAALLMAGIDPYDHEDFVIGRRHTLIHHREKHYKGFERAIVTAVSRGVLSTTRAVASGADWNGNQWEGSFDPANHTWADIDTRATMVTRDSLYSWIRKENVDIFKPRPTSHSETLIVEMSNGIQQSRKQNAEVLLIESKPVWLDQQNPLSPVELRASAACWEAITRNGTYDPTSDGKAVRSVAKAWLEEHRSEYGDLSNEAIGRIATMTNWDKKGGAPKTPSKPTHP